MVSITWTWGGETGFFREQRQAAAAQLAGHLPQQLLADIGLQVAGPARVGGQAENTVGLPLHHHIALEIVGQLYRAEQDGRTAILFRYCGGTDVQLVELGRRMDRTTRQPEQADEGKTCEDAPRAHREPPYFAEDRHY